LPKKRAKTKATILVKEGQVVKSGEPVMTLGEEPVLAQHTGKVRLEEKAVVVEFDQEGTKVYELPPASTLNVKDGDLVGPGSALTDGSVNLQELYLLQGRQAVQRYIIKEIQFIYSSQGQYLNDKHIEVIVRQMFSRAYVSDAGYSELVAGEIVDRVAAEEILSAMSGGKKQLPTIEPLLLGVTKASLTTESWLSAASFQETARVLIDAAVSGKIDALRGLKENVIIGKSIPAGTGFVTRQKELADLDKMLASTKP
jgi:DNA-directed RNA polymerase subunit beta'